MDKEQISNFELYKSELDEIHWFQEKDDETQKTTNFVSPKSNSKTIATITCTTDKSLIKKLISNGIRIFMIKGALFKSDEYTDIMRKITIELEKGHETPTFIFDLQGQVPVISTLYQKGEKKEKLSLRPGQLIKITNKNKSIKNSDLIVIDKKIYNYTKKGDSIFIESNMILNVISQEDCLIDDCIDNSRKETKDNDFKEDKEKEIVVRNIIDKKTETKDNKSQTESYYTEDFRSSLYEAKEKRESLFTNFYNKKQRSITKKKQQKSSNKHYGPSSSKDKTKHPELLIDVNKEELLRNKQNILNNEYQDIIKSNRFLSEILEHELDETSIDQVNRKRTNNDFNLSSSFLVPITNICNPNESFQNYFMEGFVPLEKNYDNLIGTSTNIKAIKSTSSRFSLRERQNLLQAGYRFRNEMLNPLITKPPSSPKKVLVCEVETPGEVHLLSETFVIGENVLPNNHLLSAKDITDISRSLKQKVSIFSAIVNRAADILEIRKIINEEPYNGEIKNESNVEYRNYIINRIKVFAKIVTNSAIKNFDQILEEADGIILDTGVLYNNMNYDDLCLIENYITEKCKFNNKPIYIKTNCFNTLHSITIPSVADISSLDSSINSGIDGFILSEYFPYENFIKLQSIIMEIENLIDGKSKYEEVSKSVKCNMDEVTKSSYNLRLLNSYYLLETIFDSAVKISFELPIKLIFLYCDSYISVKRLSKYRPNCRIITPTNNINEYNYVRVFRGVSPFYTKSLNVTVLNDKLINE